MVKAHCLALATSIGLRAASLVIVVSLISACVTQPPAPTRPQALLLVSLEDGSIIRQDIDIDADVCMKTNTDVATTCFKRAEPIFSTDNLHIIGYYMERSEISLYAE